MNVTGRILKTLDPYRGLKLEILIRIKFNDEILRENSFHFFFLHALHILVQTVFSRELA